MDTIPVHTAQTILTQLVKRAAHGETILIGDNGKPEAALTPIEQVKPKKKIIGILAGKLEVPDDFDDPLPDSVLESFYGDL